MDHILGLRCVLCGAEYQPDEVEYVCPRHGDEGILDVIYDYDLINRRTSPGQISQSDDRSIWRYSDLLPIDAGKLAAWRAELAGESHLAPFPIFQVGWTPMYHAKALGESLGLPNLYIKDDGRMPSASFKDRASAVGIVKARELGRTALTAASTGNAAASFATLTAGLGFTTHIFVPESAPPAKIAQLLIHGSNVFAVKGSYDQAFELCLEAGHAFGWYSRNTGYNPYLSEGKKTAALEICEQLTPPGNSQDMWRAPDRIFVSVGDGCIVGGLGKGLRDMQALGWIDPLRVPKLMGVQAAGSAAVHDAWQRLQASGFAPASSEGSVLAQSPYGQPLRDAIEPVDPHTLADSISAGLPRDGVKALAAIIDTGGDTVKVSDEEILAAMTEMGRQAGVFGEPAGAAAMAGLLKSLGEGQIGPDETVVVLVTGSGLKDVASAVKAAGQPQHIEPNLEAVRRALA